MLCDDKAHLLNEYVAAVDHHVVTVSELAKTGGKGAAFKKALANVEAAREEAEIARLAFKDHAETHGC
jgi:hypothetical protein